MDVVLFAFGLLFVIIGLPVCFLCEIQALWRKLSRNKTNQAGKMPYHYGRGNRIIGLILIGVGIILLILSFAGIATDG